MTNHLIINPLLELAVTETQLSTIQNALVLSAVDGWACISNRSRQEQKVLTSFSVSLKVHQKQQNRKQTHQNQISSGAWNIFEFGHK